MRQDDNNGRNGAHEDTGRHAPTATGYWVDLWRSLNVRDLLSAGTHSIDFSGSRASFVTARLRLLAGVFAVLTPLWIPVDLATLEGDAATWVVGMRVVATLLFAGLAWTSGAWHDLGTARVRLLLLVAIPLGFYVASRLILGGEGDGALVGYTFLPYLLIALISVFPLPASEALPLILLVIGMTGLTDAALGSLLTLDALAQLWLLALLGGIAVWAGAAQLHLLLTLYRQATHDPLTGLFNRGATMDRLQSEAHRARRYERPLCVILFDIDRFKRINDAHGHLAGDAVLRDFSGVLVRSSRTSDFVGRFGGEEFLLILPETGLKGAGDVAERVRKACEQANVAGPDGALGAYTVSAGVTCMRGDESVEDALRRADDALYSAKESGRNRVEQAASGA